MRCEGISGKNPRSFRMFSTITHEGRNPTLIVSVLGRITWNTNVWRNAGEYTYKECFSANPTGCPSRRHFYDTSNLERKNTDFGSVPKKFLNRQISRRIKTLAQQSGPAFFNLSVSCTRPVRWRTWVISSTSNLSGLGWEHSVRPRADSGTDVQSAYALGTEGDAEAENKPFSLTGDSFPKIIVRHDIRKRRYDENGVLNIGILDFFLDESIMWITPPEKTAADGCQAG